MITRELVTAATLSDDSANEEAANREEGLSEADELSTLRRLLLQAERKQLADFKERIETLEERVTNKQVRVVDTSEDLVPAIRKKLAIDDQLGEALKPVVVTQFHLAARQDPDEMANALFPILGPAIRKMFAAMLTPDPKARKRRYRIEQLFLMDKKSGLPICHAIGDSVQAHDADMVSGMLSAIQSFVHEAFSANEFDGLDTLQVGELSVWIEWGPDSVLAAVIRGVSPKKLRESMQLLLEKIHQDYSAELTAYDGDSSPFDLIKPELREFLGNHDGSLNKAIKLMPGSAKCWLAAAVLSAVGLLAWLVYDRHDAQRWSTYVNRVNNVPGILVVHAERQSGHYILSGLKDPLARDPLQLLPGTGIDRRSVKLQLRSYQSLHPKIALNRLITMLEPPPHVRLYLAGTTLQVVGAVAQSWKTDAIRTARTVSGVDEIIFTIE